MRSSRTRRFCASLILAPLFGVSLLLAHDDPKASDIEPPYQGPGYRRNAPGPQGPPPSFDATGVTLMSWLPLPEFGGGVSSGNDCWGYTSPSGREYAIMGTSDNTAFVEVTDPGNAQIVEIIPGPESLWRDIKVYQDHAYSVSEGGSGIQVMDLSGIDSGVVTLVNTITVGGSEATHNVAIDTDSGFLYRCGGSGNGLRIYSLANPASPVFVNSWPDRYVHDAQIVTYPPSGPYANKQIAFCCSGFNGGGTETGIDILDVTDKQNIVLLARYLYPNGEYSHQAWLSDDLQYLYLNDELDEGNLGLPTTTKVIDVSDLSAPVQVAEFTNNNSAIGHNVYVLGDLLFEANYRSGLRIFDITDPLNAAEVAYFDTYPDNDGTSFNGLWSNYPYFPSGTVLGSDLERGLFVWRLGDVPLDFTYPGGLPQLIDPNGDSFTVQIDTQPGAFIQPGSEKLFYDAGNGYQEVALTFQGGNTYLATFPPLLCGVSVDFYVEAATTDNWIVRDPDGAPANASYQAVVATTATVVFEDDMESNLGWTGGEPGDTATTGIWERVDPIGTDAQPEDDHTPAGTICWVTGQGTVGGSVGENDVDGGFTTLLSPIFDLDGLTNATISYWRWYSNSAGSSPGEDIFEISLSNNGGSSWATVEIVGPNTPESSGGWFFHEFTVADILPPTSQMQMRFVASDFGSGSIVEASVDDFQVRTLECDTSGCPVPFIRGELNGDGVVDVSDAITLLDYLFDAGPEPVPLDAGDVNASGSLNVADVVYLLEYLFQNGPPPPAPFPDLGCP